MNFLLLLIGRRIENCDYEEKDYTKILTLQVNKSKSSNLSLNKSIFCLIFEESTQVI